MKLYYIIHYYRMAGGIIESIQEIANEDDAQEIWDSTSDHVKDMIKHAYVSIVNELDVYRENEYILIQFK